MSDAQSLTLPNWRTGLRGRARKRRRPPNWRRLIFSLLWDVCLLLVNLVLFVRGRELSLVAAVIFATDLALTIRLLLREDGGFRPDDRLHIRIVLGGWFFCLTASIAHII